jgi:AbrB family looped-hinge helix DNA binding protein
VISPEVTKYIVNLSRITSRSVIPRLGESGHPLFDAETVVSLDATPPAAIRLKGPPLRYYSMESNTGEVMSVTSKGQATIPKRFREKLGVDTPGRVRFRETDGGAVVVEPVADVAEYRGSLDADESAADLVDDPHAAETGGEGRE